MEEQKVCKLEWKENRYDEAYMKSLSYGCYSRDSFVWLEGIDGKQYALLNEGVCPIHGVVISRLGGISLDKPRHPCGAYKE